MQNLFDDFDLDIQKTFNDLAQDSLAITPNCCISVQSCPSVGCPTDGCSIVDPTCQACFISQHNDCRRGY